MKIIGIDARDKEGIGFGVTGAGVTGAGITVEDLRTAEPTIIDEKIDIVIGEGPTKKTYQHTKAFLVHASEFFDAMLRNDMKESREGLICFPKKTPSEWEVIRPFLDVGVAFPKITMENAETLLQWNHELLLKHNVVESACSKALIEFIDGCRDYTIAKNDMKIILPALELALLYGLENVSKRIGKINAFTPATFELLCIGLEQLNTSAEENLKEPTFNNAERGNEGKQSTREHMDVVIPETLDEEITILVGPIGNENLVEYKHSKALLIYTSQYFERTLSKSMFDDIRLPFEPWEWDLIRPFLDIGKVTPKIDLHNVETLLQWNSFLRLKQSGVFTSCCEMLIENIESLKKDSCMNSDDMELMITCMKIALRCNLPNVWKCGGETLTHVLGKKTAKLLKVGIQTKSLDKEKK